MKAVIKTGSLNPEPKLLSDWIHHQHSLTDKLRASLKDVVLQRLSQAWVQPSWWDGYFLHIKEGLIFQREIVMKSQNIAYWYARTVIPKACFDLNPCFFNRLENETLRDLIFYSDKLHKVQFRSYSVDKQCIEYHWVKKYLPNVEGLFWVRCTEYSYQHLKSFYLMELLLPPLAELEL